MTSQTVNKTALTLNTQDTDQVPKPWYRGDISSIVDGIAHSQDIVKAKTGHALIFPKEGVRGFVLALEPSDAHVGYIGRYRDVSEGSKLSLLPYQMSAYISTKLVGRIVNVVGKDIASAVVGNSLNPEYHEINFSSHDASLNKKAFQVFELSAKTEQTFSLVLQGLSQGVYPHQAGTKMIYCILHHPKPYVPTAKLSQ